MILTYYFGAFDEEMVLSLTRWTMSALENASYFYFAMKFLGYLADGMRKEEMWWCYDMRDLYGNQLLFFYKD